MAVRHGRNIGRINSFGELLFPLPNETKRIIRLVEKSHYKINAAEIAVTFNRACIIIEIIIETIITVVVTVVVIVIVIVVVVVVVVARSRDLQCPMRSMSKVKKVKEKL